MNKHREWEEEGGSNLAPETFLFSPLFYCSSLALTGSPEAVAFGRPGDPLFNIIDDFQTMEAKPGIKT